MSDKAITSTTQEFLDVYDIVNDMVILKDASVSIILQIGTMNFSLLAEQEQDAVIFTYGSLLNSLNYPIQINIQSQTKDATKYLRLLDEQAAKASSDRKSALIKQYRGFVESLIKERNVLQKRFYIVTTAGSAEMGLITPTGLLPGQSTFSASNIEKSILLEKAANILEPRREHLIAQFNRLGLFARQLTTQEIIQNFYINYNPEAAEGQEISSSENYTTPLVRASFGGKFMQINNLMNNQGQETVAPVSASSPTPTSITPPTTDLNSVTPAPTTSPINTAPTQIPMDSTMSPPETLDAPNSPSQEQNDSPVTLAAPTQEQVGELNQTPLEQVVEQPLQNIVNQNIQALDQVQPLIQDQSLNQVQIDTQPPLSVMTTPTTININTPEETSGVTQDSQDQTSTSEKPTEINLNLDQNLIQQDQPLDNQVIENSVPPMTPSIQTEIKTETSVETAPPAQELDFSEEIIPIQNVFDSDEEKDK